MGEREISPVDVAAEITVLMREPFQRALASMMQCAPDPDSIKNFAKKSPDRWAQAVSQLARLAGYHDESVPNINVLLIGQLSDADLMKRLSNLRNPLKGSDLPALTGEVVRKEAP